MVVIVVPCLGTRDIYLLSIGVGNGEACCSIACGRAGVVGNVVLFDGVNNSCAVGFVLIET